MATASKVGPEVLVNTYTDLAQMRPAIARIDATTFVVIWDDQSGLGGGSTANPDYAYPNINGQVFSTAGGRLTKVGPEFIANVLGDGMPLASGVIGLSGSTFLVSWYGEQVIKGAVFSIGAGGATRLGAPLSITAQGAGPYDSTIVALSDTTFISAWSDHGARARLYSTAGGAVTQIGPDLLFTAPEGFTTPVIAPLSPTSFVAVLEDWETIRGQVYTVGTGGAVKSGAEFVVTPSSLNGITQTVTAALSADRFVVVWNQENGDGNSWGIKGQLYTVAGGVATKSGGEFLVNTQTTGSQWEPSLSVLSEQRFVVTWGDNEVKAQVFSTATGAVAKEGGEFVVNTQTFGEQGSPVVTALSPSRFAIAWEDDSERGDGSLHSIKAQLFQLADDIAIETALVRQSEGPGGITRFVFTVRRSGDLSEAASVQYAVTGSGADAANAGDFAGLALPSGLVTFAPGATTATITVEVLGDAQAERDEGFTVTLSGAVNANIAVVSASGVIVNDDSAASTLAIGPAEVAQAEGPTGGASYVFTVTRTGDLSGSVLVSYAVSGDGPDAADATDFDGGVLPTGLITFAPGAATAQITINVAGDPLAEANEAFSVRIFEPSGGLTQVTTPTARGLILDDDGVPAGPGTSSRAGAEFVVNTQAVGNQGGVVLETLTASRAVAVWSDLQAGVSSALRGQVLQTSGETPAKVGPEFLIDAVPFQAGFTPDVVKLSDTSFIVAWATGGAAVETDIQARLYTVSAAGVSASGEALRLNTVTPGVQHEPSLTALSPTTFVTTWSTLDDLRYPAVKGQLMSTAGGGLTKLGSEFQVNVTVPQGPLGRDAFQEHQSSVAALSADSFVVTWTSSRVPYSVVKGQVFTTAGGVASKLAAEFAVSNTTRDSSTNSSVAVLSPTTFVVLWNNEGLGVMATGRVFSTAGGVTTPVGSEFRVMNSNSGSHSGATVAALSPTSFVVSWTDTLEVNNPEVTGGVSAQVFAFTGGTPQPVGGRIRVNSQVEGSQNDPSAIALTANSFLVAFTDEGGVGADTSGSAVKAQLFSNLYLPQALTNAFGALLRVAPRGPDAQAATLTQPDGSQGSNPFYQQLQALSALATDLTQGRLSQGQVDAQLRHMADATTSVATLAYQFFTGRTPSQAGYDYLVHSTGNANDLNDAYYLKFSTENRYINFAVNLGKVGEGAARFQAEYGALSLQASLVKAYTAIFGTAPDAAKVEAILNGQVVYGGAAHTRAEYFATYGMDGLTGIGTKAAMVGWLLAEAVKADTGVYAQANIRFLNDLFDGNASFNVDLLAAFAASPAPDDIALVGVAPDLAFA